MELHKNDILTRVSRFNLIRNGRMIYIDVHQKIQGKLAGNFIAVPNLVNIVAKPRHQGKGDTEQQALEDCLTKIKGLNVEELFPLATPMAEQDEEDDQEDDIQEDDQDKE
ncbi:MAG: hypothetical protein GY729_21720 [Desulfobacteraceae bacterium]|nr:hypothetical protein [Desulfobacteraceae bacterium]